MMDFRQRVYLGMITEHDPLSWSAALHPTPLISKKLRPMRQVTDDPMLCSRLYHLATTTKGPWASEDSCDFSPITLTEKLRQIRKLVFAERRFGYTLDELIKERYCEISDSEHSRSKFSLAARIIEIARARLALEASRGQAMRTCL